MYVINKHELYFLETFLHSSLCICYCSFVSKGKMICIVILCVQVRLELQAEILRQRTEGSSHRQPEVTTKHGKLKPDRKSKPQRMYVDDLAALDILSEVGSEALGRQYSACDWDLVFQNMLL
jgi:hypothetical protein